MKHVTGTFEAFLLLAFTLLQAGVCQANGSAEPLMDVSCRVRSVPQNPLIHNDITFDQSALGKPASSRPDSSGDYWISLAYTGKSEGLRSVVLTIQNSHTTEELFYGWLRLAPGVPQFIKVQNRVSVECFFPEKGSGLKSDPADETSLGTPSSSEGPWPSRDEIEEDRRSLSYPFGRVHLTQ